MFYTGIPGLQLRFGAKSKISTSFPLAARRRSTLPVSWRCVTPVNTRDARGAIEIALGGTQNH